MRDPHGLPQLGIADLAADMRVLKEAQQAAQKLLETTELSIGTVAEQTGFASAAHFRRVFRETMGTGPLQYRKSHRT